MTDTLLPAHAAGSCDASSPLVPRAVARAFRPGTLRNFVNDPRVRRITW